MKKNKLYLLISIITLITFFGTAALCNQAENSEETKIDVEEDDYIEEEVNEKEEEEELIGEVSEEEREVETEEEEGPTIILGIHQGPTYSSADDVCYYRIEAIVTGSPTPVIEFSRDDSMGAFGSKKCQVNLYRGESYTLIATATNSKGSSSATITLVWGCNGEELIVEENNEEVVPDQSDNRPPEVSEINVIPVQTGPTTPHIFTRSEYEIYVSANDPDSNPLTYEWSVSDGSIEDSNSSRAIWTTPNAPGNYEVVVVVRDNLGGETTKSRIVNVEESQ